MLSINFQIKVFREYHQGKPYSVGTKYRYTIEYHPMHTNHTWLVRQDKKGGSWEWVHPLDLSIDRRCL